MVHQISNRCLSIDKIKEILTKGYEIEISSESEEAVIKCREYLDSKMEDMDRPVYGVTTGFGSLCNITIPAEDLSALQHNLVVSHACGTGDTVSPEIVKLMLLLKIQSLAYGHSGVQLATIQRLVDMFNNNVLPVVYQQGSLGASGDLAPLAHLSLPLIGLGEVEYKGQRRPSAEVWAELGWEPLKLQSKEGLALLNGTQFMSAHGVWSIIRCERLSEWACLMSPQTMIPRGAFARKWPFGRHSETAFSISFSRRTLTRNSGRALRELYIRPYEYAMEIEPADTIMTGYNAVNGKFCDEDYELLEGIFREELGFDGFAMSDWNSYDTSDTRAMVRAGISVLTPGSDDGRYVEPLKKALQAGEITRGELQRNVMRLLRVLCRRLKVRDYGNDCLEKEKPGKQRCFSGVRI